MDMDPINALSRHATVQICNECGSDEAIRDFTGQALPLNEWEIAKKPKYFIKEKK